MGDKLTMPSYVALPDVARRIVEAIEVCLSVERIHLARVRHDRWNRQHPATAVFKKGSGMRVVVELYYERRKYSLDVTPSRGLRPDVFVGELARAMLQEARFLLIEGLDAFQVPREEVLSIVPDVSEAFLVPSPKEAIFQEENPVMAEGLRTESVTVVEDASGDHAVAGLLVVPDGIWSPRAIAVYHFIHDQLLMSTDPKKYELLDDLHGRVYGVFTTLGDYFGAGGGTVFRALDPLKEHGILKKEVTDGKETGWFLYRFVENVPVLSMSDKDLWNSVNRPRKAARAVSAAVSPQEEKEQVIVSHVVSEESQSPRRGGMSIPTDLDGQLRMLADLEEAIRGNAHAVVMQQYAESVESLRTQRERVSRQIEPIIHLLTPQDRRLVEQLLESWGALADLTRTRVDAREELIAVQMEQEPLFKRSEVEVSTDDDPAMAGALAVLDAVKSQSKQQRGRKK